MSYSESWKKVDGFLEVSTLGRVKSHGKPIKGEITKGGYHRINVSHEGKRAKYLVHRLVAEAFIPNPDNLPVVNHIDGNKLNNNVDNLEFVSYGGNLAHAYKTGLRSCDGELNNMHKLTETEVLEIRRNYVKGKHSENNSRGLANKYGVNPKTILNIVNGRSWVTI